MKKTLFYFLLLLPLWLQAQIVTTSPAFPQAEASVDIVFDASLSSGGLADYTGDDIYAHTGVITDKSTSNSDWKYAPTWLDNDPKFKLTSLGNNKWKLNISPSIREYYGVPADQKILKMAFVFRNANGTKEGKDNGKDIFINVYESTLNVSFEAPELPQFIEKNTTLSIKANSSEQANLRLLLDDTELIKAIDSESISTSYTFTQSGSYWLIAEATASSNTVRDSVYVNVIKTQVEQPLPSNVRAGINYINDNTATFVLYAPNKKNVFLIGDFNDWVAKNDYMLNKDGAYWWITLSNLEKGKEYAFQYFVDGELKIADPYSDKILDPWNDQYIPSTVYPNLKPYPTGKTTGITSVVQTGQTPYTWTATNFAAPAKDKLVIYELLVRDFTEQHSFESTMNKLDYLQSLGINAIELMPINEFEGNSSWGYNPSFYFAVDKYYGTKNAFKAFVDKCHRRGIALIIDMVLNHSYGQSPLVQLYWDKTNSRPSADNPWYNVVSPNSAYSWGYDFNHESPQTQALTDSVCSYWMKEYKVDGFRFDFTKGFTNTPGDGWAFDQSRIDILKRMTSEIHKRNPNAFVILEHLAENREEKTLAEADMMLWGNMNNNYNEATMGWTENKKSDLSWGLYSKRDWTESNLVAYMESHDEERLMFKAQAYGNENGSYSIQEEKTALERGALSAAFYLTLPGPKMIWQFGEVGYDYSINTCSDGVTISDNCRLAEKPIRWDYLQQPNRKALFDVYAKLISLKKEYPVFASKDILYSLEGAQKYFVWKSNDLNAFVVGNFDVVNATINVPIPSGGKWYELFSGKSLDIPSSTYTVILKPGEYKLFVDKNISNIIDEEENDKPLLITNDEISYNGEGNVKSMKIYDLNGRLQKSNRNENSISLTTIPPNVLYIIRVESEDRVVKDKFIKR